MARNTGSSFSFCTLIQCLTGFLRQKTWNFDLRHISLRSPFHCLEFFLNYSLEMWEKRTIFQDKKNRWRTYRNPSHKRTFLESQKKYWLFIQIYRMPLVLYVLQHSQKEINHGKKASFHLHHRSKSCFENNTVGQAIIFTQTANVQS